VIAGRRRPRDRGAPVVGVLLVLLVACSGSGSQRSAPAPVTTTSTPPATSPSTAPPSTPGSTTVTSTTGPARCTTQELSLRANGGGAATGHAVADFELRNTSSRPCRMLGYPGVRVLDASGATMTDAQRTSGFILGDAPPAAVIVPAGQVAYFGVESVNVCNGGADPRPSASLRVTPPDETAALTVAANINVCPGNTVLVSPIRATAAEIPRH
jgi:hypothetical protein